MKKAYIVLANSTSANFYQISEKSFHFKLIKRMRHAESRLKEQALDADGPGHYQKGFYKIRGAYAEPTSHKNLEIENFAKALCKELENRRLEEKYSGIIIVAEPHFYGLIKTNATTETRKMIKFHFSKDYTHYSEKELMPELQKVLGHELRNIFIT